MSDTIHSAVITGIGILSPIGNSPAEVLANLRAGRDGISEATKIDTSKFVSHINAEVRGVDFDKRLSPAELETFTDPYLRLAICAARDAVADSGVDCDSDTAMVLATCNGGINSQEAEYKAELGLDGAAFSREISVQGESFSAARAMACSLKIGGACFVVNTACSGSTAAIAIAEMLISLGLYKKVLAGGADAMSLANFAGFSALKVVSQQKTAPFSNPVGMNIGEGAAFWIVEDRAAANARSAKVYGKVIGHATSGDAHHPTQPDPRGDGAFRTMRRAAENAGIELCNLGCVNAHGSGTQANDRAETKAISKFLGGAPVPFTSTKSYHGHCMGATGAIEATCQLLSMNDGFMPPTLHFDGLRAGCEIAPASVAADVQYGCFLSANYAFAGNNAAIVVASENFENYSREIPDTSARAVITGFSAVSSLGVGAAENMAALAADKVGIAKISRFDSPRMAGLVDMPDPRKINRRLDFSGMNAVASYATIACAGALENAALRIRRDNSENVGLVAAVSRGSSEEAHMLGVFADPEMRGNIACFSNETSNSTAGWVSKALEIKGANITFTSGHNSGLQTLEYAKMLLRCRDAAQIAVFAADELYAHQLKTYAAMGYLHEGEVERLFKMKYSSEFKTVFGEGSCAAVVETPESAAQRGAAVLGEIVSAASTTDGGDFYDANLTGDGLARAVDLALTRAGISAGQVGCISWSPRGCAQDSKIVNLRDNIFGRISMATTVFHTGYMETTSALHSLLCLLRSYADGVPIWRQRFGLENFDAVKFPENPEYILALSSSWTGNNHAVVVRRG